MKAALLLFVVLCASSISLGLTQSSSVPCCDCPTTVACTLTQGYWKNHNKYAKIPALDIPWPISEDTTFCTGGATWLTILETPPSGGNAYLILAHQYIAAKLNVAEGATDAAGLVTGWLAAAEPLLQGSGCVNETLASTDRAEAIQLASQLNAFNNGLIGPGYCNSTPVSSSPTPASSSPTPSPSPSPSPSTTPGTLSCPNSAAYWQANQSKWPSGTSSKTLCGISWATILTMTTTSTNEWYLLAGQYVSVLLNQAGGIDTSAISDSLTLADTLLSSNCGSGSPSFPTSSDISEAVSVQSTLAEFNNGQYTSGCFVPSYSTRRRDVTLGCTYTQGYWKNHPSAWPAAPSGVTYTLCGMSWETVFETSGSGGSNGWYPLAHQWIAAELNVYSGAWSGAIGDELNYVGNLLASSCTTLATDVASTFTAQLTAFNQGQTTVPHCGTCPYCVCASQQPVTSSFALEPAVTIYQLVVGSNIQPETITQPANAWNTTTTNNNDGTTTVTITATIDSQGYVVYSGVSNVTQGGNSNAASSSRSTLVGLLQALLF